MLKIYSRATALVALSLVMFAIVPPVIFAQREVQEFNEVYCDPAIPAPKTAEEAAERGPNCQGTKISSPDAGLMEKYGLPFLNFLGSIVGLVVTISIVAGGIQYSAAADDPTKLAAARARIRNAVIALAAFLFLYGLLQWLVPGGFI